MRRWIASVVIGITVGWGLVLLAPPVLAQEAEAEASPAAEQPAGEEPAQSEQPAGEAGAAEGETAAAEKKPKPEKAIENPVAALRKLLVQTRADASREREEDVAREAGYRTQLEEQERLLKQTQALVRREEDRSLALDERWGQNELDIEELGTRLAERLGQMGELFGVVKLVATDMSSEVWESLTSLGVEPRIERLDKLGRSKDLPSTDDLELLWYELQREMTLQGRVASAVVPVIEEEGTTERRVVRAGPFTAYSEGHYVSWDAEAQKPRLLERQPPPRYTNTIDEHSGGGGKFRRLSVDPSRGVLLEALTDTPSLLERVKQGGSVGYVIITLGLAALALGLVRLMQLTVMGRRVGAAAEHDRASDDNPLGRVRGVFESNRGIATETLELKLDEAVMREVSHVERYLWIVQTVSIIAPLLGLLGTVTGMIQTFQAITLFGAGDPKVMAKGISEALVTTTLGLVTAIPLVLLHALLASRSKQIIEVIDEGTSELVAKSLEEHGSSA